MSLIRQKKSRQLLCLSLLLCAIGFSISPIYADGGAPQLAYVAGTTRGVSIIDIAQRRVTGTITVAGHPQTVLLSLDGSTLYVSQPALGQVVAINARSGKTLCVAHLPGQPSLLAFSLDGTVLYAAGQGDSNVRALNPTTCAVQRIFQTHEPVYGLAVTASTAVNATPSTPEQLWITGSTMLTVFEVDGHLLGTVPIAGGPQYICIPGGFTAYVTTRQGTVVAVDLNTRHIIGTLLSGGQFGPMDYNAITGEVYVPDRLHNQLDVLVPVTADAGTLPKEPVRTLHMSSSPQSIAITSDGLWGFVALANGQVLMLDLPGRKDVASITVGGVPQFIITGLYPPAVSATPAPQKTATLPASMPPVGTLLLIIAIILATLLAALSWFLWRRYQMWLTGQRSPRKPLK
jgi:DNA-binding beta-propeller fold protein YncE